VLNGFGWPHILIIAVLIIILFGAKRLPDAAPPAQPYVAPQQQPVAPSVTDQAPAQGDQQR
jgi:hypothetical protein